MKSKDFKIPQHVAIIMDGNRRWAKRKGLSAIGGHNYVVDKVIEPLIEHSGKLGIEYLTLWAFSTENWSRDKQEVEGLMKLFRKALLTKVKGFIEKGAQLVLIGDIERFPQDIKEEMKRAIEMSKLNNKITVAFALNYGGRDEIMRAVNQILQQREKNCEQLAWQGSELYKERILAISEDEFANYLDTAEMPDPDLLIRTGGEKRLSGFLPWQSTYSELYFTDTLMPDFTTEEFDLAIEDYQVRQRRFGK